MDSQPSQSSVELDSFASQENLLDEQLATPSSSMTGHGGADLSFSELSSSRAPGDAPRPPRTREERLQSDLFKLRKINDAMSTYLGALTNAQTSTQHVSKRMEATGRLLNQYIDIVWQTEQTARLVFDPEWQGGVEDEMFLERERLAREVRERQEREERERAAREEAERVERERVERERQEAEKAKQAARAPVVRGVRGIRARGVPAPSRAAPSLRGRAAPRGTTRGRGA
ncbi:hypothetical protein EXIGLDRAFT_830899 [Exidia glandulosa HHB12029]|uniref:DASH complex subunit DUO1 n=1 Tax=Exidia glandulosa HHB12029 TaxID=1314781 RepID=A0A165N5K7_EXIGL|nr:hypothetical protein EXIGLDRAFT_830899 [Exidia glandulosa HHB12029]